VSTFQIRPVNKDDKPWVSSLLAEWWVGPKIVTRGKLHHADELPGFIAMKDGQPAGLITYNITGDQCEVVTLDSLIEKIGIGVALIDEVKKVAAAKGCQRLWLVTTNDNTKALRFYQKYRFLLVAVHRNAIVQDRLLKPEIPLVGNDGIPIRDEIELEMVL
jgi:GNAT superfamily N-acetyltransferase